MPNPFERPVSPSETTAAPGKIKPFSSVDEAVDYSRKVLELDQVPKDSGELPWKESAETSGPRGALRLRLDYLGDYRRRESLKQDKAFMDALQEVKLHDGYDVEPEAPKEIAQTAERLKILGQQLPFDIAFMELQAKEIEDGTHPLCIQLKQVEAGKDETQILILQTEIGALGDILQEDLERYRRALDFVQNRQVWEQTLAPKAVLLKRLNEVTKIAQSPRPEGDLPQAEHDAYLIAKAEAVREMGSIMQTGLAPGNPDLQLYLYQNPDLAPSMEFAPQHPAAESSPQVATGSDQVLQTVLEREKIAGLLGQENFREITPGSASLMMSDNAKLTLGEFTLIYRREITPAMKGYVQGLIYQAPDGRLFHRNLKEAGQYGWTHFEAESLIKSMKQKEAGSIQDEEMIQRLDKTVEEKGFTREMSPSASRKAIFDGMVKGEFLRLSHPEGDIAKKPEKQGYVHTVIYKSSDGECWLKIPKAHQYGWTNEEAVAYVAYVKEHKGEEK